jgi:hypothetical protein
MIDSPPKGFTTSAQAISLIGQSVLFEHIAPIPLHQIFTGYGPLPSVVKTTDQTGLWDSPGQTRIVHLSDGSTAKEKMISYDLPHSFSYTVSEFTGPMRFLTTHAYGIWEFETNDAGCTSVKWQYTFYPRSSLTSPILYLVTKTLWRGYMNTAIRLACKPVVDSEEESDRVRYRSKRHQ